MAESEEEPEHSQNVEAIESSNEQNEVVVLLDKMANTQSSQRKSTNITVKRIPDEKIGNPKKSLKREPVEDEKDEEIDFIVLEEISQGAVENNKEPVENEEIEQNLSKRIRFEIEKPTQRPNESNKSEKKEKNSIQKPAGRKVSNIKLPIVRNNNTDGIVSSSESVDVNNEETYFALSLVGILKRLPPHKRAIAKCHILSYLTELEYGSSSLS